jgi:16S rRNA (guanine966-N2)-methyltransferase
VTRIISGTAGGRRLKTPAGSATRPTSDKVREALFSGLESRDVLRGAHVLDLYAGSGALGLEAASRGAASVVLVESDRRAAAVARDNAGSLGLASVSVRTSSVERLLAGAPTRAVDLVLADPPYDVAEDALAHVLTLLSQRGWLAADALLVVERSTRSPEPTWPSGIVPEGSRTYGETTLWFAGTGARAGERHDGEPAATGAHDGEADER